MGIAEDRVKWRDRAFMEEARFVESTSPFNQLSFHSLLSPPSSSSLFTAVSCPPMTDHVATVAAPAGTRRFGKRHALLLLTFSAVFICYIDRVNISVAALAMQESFGWSETRKGFVLSSFFIGYLIFQVPSGYLANRYGGKIVLGLAVIWWSLCTLITPMAAAGSFGLLIAARVLMGIGEAAMFPAAYNLFGRW